MGPRYSLCREARGVRVGPRHSLCREARGVRVGPRYSLCREARGVCVGPRHHPGGTAERDRHNVTYACPPVGTASHFVACCAGGDGGHAGGEGRGQGAGAWQLWWDAHTVATRPVLWVLLVATRPVLWVLLFDTQKTPSGTPFVRARGGPCTHAHGSVLSHRHRPLALPTYPTSLSVACDAFKARNAMRHRWGLLWQVPHFVTPKRKKNPLNATIPKSHWVPRPARRPRRSAGQVASGDRGASGQVRSARSTVCGDVQRSAA